jgi:hypothetical protein
MLLKLIDIKNVALAVSTPLGHLQVTHLLKELYCTVHFVINSSWMDLN